jgi:isopenicillin N synthase-like dioxygenase
MASALPIIDFGPFLSASSTAGEKTKVALEIDKACREVGFFYLKNHGVPSNLIAEILGKSRDFFETATPEEKQRLALRKTDEGGDNARGWLRINNSEKGSHEVSGRVNEQGKEPC